MNRRAAILIVIPATLVALTAVVLLSLAATETAPAAVAEAAPAAEAAAVAAAAPAAETVCIRGAGAAAAALAEPVIVDGKLDAAKLADVSRRAFALERARERAADGPAWPQRMGLDAAGDPVAPPPACVSLAP